MEDGASSASEDDEVARRWQQGAAAGDLDIPMPDFGLGVSFFLAMLSKGMPSASRCSMQGMWTAKGQPYSGCGCCHAQVGQSDARRWPQAASLLTKHIGRWSAALVLHQ